MSSMTFLAVAIVVAAIALVVGCAVALTAEKPPTKTIPMRLWCPVAATLTRVGVTKAVDRRLTVVSCDRFPDGPVACDSRCVAEMLVA